MVITLRFYEHLIIIKNLNNHLDKLEQIKNEDEFNNWHTYLVSFVSSIIEPKSPQFQQILRNNIYGISTYPKTFEEEKYSKVNT